MLGVRVEFSLQHFEQAPHISRDIGLLQMMLISLYGFKLLCLCYNKTFDLKSYTLKVVKRHSISELFSVVKLFYIDCLQLEGIHTDGSLVRVYLPIQVLR